MKKNYFTRLATMLILVVCFIQLPADAKSFNADYTTVHQLKRNSLANHLRQKHLNTSLFTHYFCIFNPDSTTTITSGLHSLWNTPKNMIGDIIIESNASLTITSTLKMPENAKIIVKQGGKLIIDGGHITNICNKMWQGIEVWGTYNQHQFPINSPIYQGKIELKNGAIISNAIIAVTLMKPSEFNTTGGLINANNATFLNNKKSVEFLSYHNFHQTTRVPWRNFSSFANTAFIIDDNYIGKQSSSDFRVLISMWDVEGVNFTACKFEDRRNIVYQAEDFPCGIYTIDAGFTIKGECSSNPLPCPTSLITHSSFKGFTTAVRITGASTAKTTSITQTNFEDNLIGIHISSINNVAVTNSNFLVGGGRMPNSLGTQIGVKLKNASGYIIQNNTFTRDHPNLGLQNIGTYTEDSGVSNNRISKNSFTNLLVGQFVIGGNRNATGSEGLEFMCNTNNNYGGTDFIIQKQAADISIYEGIKENQGSMTLSSGNRFSIGGGHLMNMANRLNYHHHGGDSDPSTITNSTKYYTTNINTCNTNPSSLVFFPLPSPLLNDLNNHLNNTMVSIANLEYNYNQLIDGGSTSSLLEEIQNSWPSQAWELRASLIGKSPYLSTKVLSETIKQGVLPQAMILELCLANPDATKSERFIEFLQYEKALPVYMIELIRANWIQKTPRTILESNIASFKENKDFTINLFITNEMMQEQKNLSSIHNWLTQRNTLTDNYALADSYIEEGNTDQAQSLLSELPLHFNIDDILYEEYDSYMDYKNLREEWISKKKNLAQLSPTEVQDLLNFASNAKGIAKTKAYNILCFFYNICEDLIILTPNEETYVEKMAPPIHNATQVINKEYNSVNVFPNPASTFTTFEWDIPLLENEAILTITDISGKVVLKHPINYINGQWVWDTRNTPSGVYLYEILDNKGISINNGKIIVKN